MVESAEPPAPKPAEPLASGSAGNPVSDFTPVVSSAPATPQVSPQVPAKTTSLLRRILSGILVALGVLASLLGVLALVAAVGRTLERIDNLQAENKQLREKVYALEKEVGDLKHSVSDDSKRVEKLGLWKDCQETERLTGRPHAFLENTFKCVEDLNRIVSPAVRSPAP